MERQWRSPPKHRHDGTSPLPLGMDWSPPPKKWNGRDKVWPHDSRTGWSYCIAIPTWVVLPKSGESEAVVFYRVQVGLQSPEGVTTTRVVLRRFNDFLRLLAALRKVFPKKNLPPAPPKGLLRLRSGMLLEERRCCLEEWMTKLLSDIDISRSIVVASFLELESAARSSFQDENQQIVQENHFVNKNLSPHTAGELMVAGSTAVTPDYGSDTAYEASDIGTSTLGRDNISEAGTEDPSLDEDLAGPLEKLVKYGFSNIDEDLFMGHTILEQVEGYPQPTIHDINKDMRASARNGNGSHLSYLAVDRSECMSEPEHGKVIGNSEKLSNGNLRSETNSLRGNLSPDMGYTNSWSDGHQISQRGDDVSSDRSLVIPFDRQQKMNRILISLQRRLGTANTDMEDLISRLNQEIAVKDYLTTKVKDLEEELETTKQRGKENLQQAILMERGRLTQMQWDMEELRQKSLEMEFKLKSRQDDKPETESSQISVIEEKDQLLQELDATKNKLEQLLKKHQELEVKSKTDVKVLVKEIKSLRSSQADLKQQLNQSLVGKSEAEKLLQQEKQKVEEEKIARMKLLHDSEVLHQRLCECSVNVPNETEDNLLLNSSSVQDALELLQMSDEQFEVLLAQAHILSQEDDRDFSTMADIGKAEDGGTLPNHELKNMLAKILVDNITLRKQVGSVIRHALKFQSLTGKEDVEVPAENESLDTRPN